MMYHYYPYLTTINIAVHEELVTTTITTIAQPNHPKSVAHDHFCKPHEGAHIQQSYSPSPHLLKYVAVPTLSRQVEVLANVWALTD